MGAGFTESRCGAPCIEPSFVYGDYDVGGKHVCDVL